MPANEFKDFTFENYQKRIRFSKKNPVQWKTLEKEDLQLFLTKLPENMSDSSNAKEYYNFYLKKKPQHQLLQNTQKLHINSPRPEDGLKRFPKEVLAKVQITIYLVKQKKS